ncbi:MAG: hypothetical protein A2W99_00045 [Bacteroidetes bacterium GWF2_33_16]|nr:MAG: hypothetical protein A2X00_02750 [Bacteroidetes bacterium GWE2_32_14]OFY08667.1 MAG: hypothetical protein A2W99_00045 [Bacteroidetes bacterium GWF2_33_16]
MKILVIGASGMLAKPVIKKLDKEGFQLRLFSRTVRNSLFEKDYDIIQGNVFNVSDLDRAMSGCDAVHISLSNIDEAKATEAIIESAKKHRIKIISYVSGCTVSNENRWFKMIDNKYRAEQTIIESGISYIIFRPTWFFESLDLMVRNGKAIIIGKQPNPSHWVAADDFARMIATAYKKSEALNKIFYIIGPETFLMKELLERYIQENFAAIKKVSSVPIGMIKIIAMLTCNKQLRNAAELFAYFEKVKEVRNTDETNLLLGKPEITFDQWLLINR